MSEEIQGESPSHDDNAAPSTAPDANTEVSVEASAAESTEEAKKPNRVQERINQLTTKNYEERQKNAQLEERLKKLESSQSPKDPRSDLVAPNEDEFDTHYEYQAASAKFIAESASKAAYERIRAEQETVANNSRVDQRQSDLESKKKVFEENLSSKRENFQDFEDIAYGHNFMDIDIAEQIFEMEKGPEVAYYLGSNLDEAQRIHSLTSVQRARELTKLEFQVESLTPKVVSDAPEAIKTLGNSESVDNAGKDGENIKDADVWQKWRNEQLYG